LRNWGVIRRVHKSGDRRDFYVVEPDVWKMFFRIAVERRKREFEPALHSLRHLISEAAPGTDQKVLARLESMEDLLSIIDSIADRLLESEEKSRTMLDFFTKIAVR
ncbi:GbsR/MarR family transcriptional regulator, partial [Acidobacteriota bacterium]